MSTPACTHCPAMGHQIRARGCVSQQDTHVLTLFIALGVSFNPSTRQTALVQLRDPVQAQSLSSRGNGTQYLHPGKGHQMPLFWGGGGSQPF